MITPEFRQAIKEELERRGKTNTKAYEALDYLMDFITDKTLSAYLDGQIGAARREVSSIRESVVALQNAVSQTQRTLDAVSKVTLTDQRAKEAYSLFAACGGLTDDKDKIKAASYVTWAYLNGGDMSALTDNIGEPIEINGTDHSPNAGWKNIGQQKSHRQRF